MKLKSFTEAESLDLLQSNFKHSLKEAFLIDFPIFTNSENLFFFGDDSKPKATILYHRLDFDLYELDFIAVAPDFRGQGLAKALLDKIKGRVWLEVHEKNQKALGLYEAVGFKKVGIRKAYYGLHSAILLEKKA